MTTKLETISNNLKVNGFSPKTLSVENTIIIHDEGYEWAITDSTIRRYDWKKGQMNCTMATFGTVAGFNQKFESLMVA